jgi:hypothetical protein
METIRATSNEEYAKLLAYRNNVISENRARRMRSGPKQEPMPVPPKPLKPLILVAYGPDGSFEGVCKSMDDVPFDCTAKWEEQ